MPSRWTQRQSGTSQQWAGWWSCRTCRRCQGRRAGAVVTNKQKLFFFTNNFFIKNPFFYQETCFSKQLFSPKNFIYIFFTNKLFHNFFVSNKNFNKKTFFTNNFLSLKLWFFFTKYIYIFSSSNNNFFFTKYLFTN